MDSSVDSVCPECADLLRRHPQRLQAWQRSPISMHGYISNGALEVLTALGRLPPDVEAQVRQIVAGGRVHWLDVDPAGHYQVWWAPHGEIPREVKSCK